MRWQCWAQRLALVPLLALAVLLAGCALAPTPTNTPALRAEQSAWNGRLALQIEEQTGQAAQSFSAAFELQGTAAQGDLTLISPLGNVLARLDWAPGHARLESGGNTQESTSLDVLLVQMTGTALPVRALFDWLRGVRTTASGWQANLSDIDQGRLEATRHTPTPRTILRIVFEP